MIVYRTTLDRFTEDLLNNRVAETVQAEFEKRFGKAGAAEANSWKNSLDRIGLVVSRAELPEDAGIAIEYTIPQTAKRVDFIVTGIDGTGTNSAVIIELKQWTEARRTPMDGVVETYVGNAHRAVNHPSYQAWSYAQLLEDFNEAVRSVPVVLRPCAYLHNMADGRAILDPFYSDHVDKAPVFLKEDGRRLQAFIQERIDTGDGGSTIDLIEEGKIRPSKNLADVLASMLAGNREFLMIDEQKIVYETALNLAKRNDGRKRVLIVDGGPGTGKSVVAVNLLVALTGAGKVSRFVSKNVAPRAVFESKLAGTFRKTRITEMFTGSGSFVDTQPNAYDVLLVDEAHRLNEKSGIFKNKGENQIKELILASRLSVFFLDEDQRVTFSDIGEKEQIKEWAQKLGAEVVELALASQFRCNGSDGYLAWVDNTLGVRPTANPTLEGIDYDFQVCSDPVELHERIRALNEIDNQARLVAGYCWEWPSKTTKSAFDILIPEFAYAAQWNFDSANGPWIVRPDSVAEVGCIHTCQGCDLDYVGVIIGPDLVVRDGVVKTRPEMRARSDKSLSGYQKLYRSDPEAARRKADAIIKNTYRTLMTRGRKGCLVWSTDPETNEYLISSSRRT